MTDSTAPAVQPRGPAKIGLLLPQLTGVMGGKTARWTELLAIAERAQAVGFASLWVIDQFWFRYAEILQGLGLPVSPEDEQAEPMGGWEPWSLLAALAAAVPHVELGTLVTCTGYRNPALLAKMADTVDEISGGRLILGLGAGDSAFEHRAFGYPLDHRVGRFEEALTIIRMLLRAGQGSFSGTYHEIRHCELRPRGPRRHGPPILIGSLATGPRMLRLTVQHADVWNGYLASGRSHPDVLPPLLDAVDRACLEHDRDPATLERSVTVMVSVFDRADPTADTIGGSAEEIAGVLSTFAMMGITHIQVILIPSTVAGVEAFAPVIEELDGRARA